jgi:gliding motility-associated protein GldC
MMKESEIKIKITLDENKVPEQIYWTAEDAGEVNQKSEAILMSLWDAEKQNSLRIDLWTKEMKVDEMKTFFHQTLVAMSDTFERATGDEKMAGDMRRFCEYFAEELDLVKDIKKK